MENNKKIKFSVNPLLIDKNQHEDRRAFSEGFVSIEDTIDELAQSISEDGFAFSYQYSGNRCVGNFMATDFLAVDIDGGTTINETLSNPIVKNHCSMLYTTPSHTPEQHRFRLVFILPRTITKASELTAATKALSRLLGGDPSATDAARIFYGSRGSEPQIFDASITDGFLEELLELGRTTPIRDSITNTHSTANRSAYQFKKDLQVRTSTGSVIEVLKLNKTTSIYCPFHPDRSPSALVGINKKANHYIHCKKCQMTWWMQGSSVSPYNFYAFDEQVRTLQARGVRHENETPFGDFVEFPFVPSKNIHIRASKFLKLDKLDDGITLIKSPKGSGKTTFLSEIVKSVIYPFATLDAYEEATDFEVEIPMISKEKVLLIGHRQALIGDLCHRLGLNCYLDDAAFKSGEVAERQKRYGVCLDSLSKVRGISYDIVVIDEVEQVLAHFMSETVGERRVDLFRLFCEKVQTAKKIVALDADLGWISFTTLTHLTRPTVRTGVQSRTPSIPVHIYINDYKSVDRSILLYSSMGQLTQHMNESVLSGKRVFVTSNSKEKVKALAHSLKKMAVDAGIDVQIQTITSENSKKPEVQTFIKNIKTEILNYQVILSSPSLGTGIDITFENEAQEIDCVYGIFENRINSHFEIDQQLARVRHPKEVHVWVSPQQFMFETEFNVVKTDYFHDRLLDVVIDGVDDGSSIDLSDVDQRFCVLAAMITTHQRASKNHLKRNFVEYKQRQGWTVSVVEVDDDLVSEGNEILRIGKLLKKADDVQRVVSARVMNQYEFTQFKRRHDSNEGYIEPEEWYSYIRTRVELFYGQEAGPALVELDDKGNFASQIRMFEALSAAVKEDEGRGEGWSQTTIPQTVHNQLFKNRGVAVKLLHKLFAKTPFFENGRFDSKVTFTRADLHDFIQESRTLDSLVQTHLDIAIRADMDEKPILHLSSLLKKVGLHLVQSRKPTTSNGQKTYYYSVSENDLDTIEKIIHRREGMSNVGWNYVNAFYGFEYSSEEEDTIFA